MAAKGEGSAVLSLTDGIVETVVDESTGGAMLVSDNTRLTAEKGTLSPRPGWEVLGNPAAGSPRCYGMFPGCGDSTIAIFRPSHGSRRIVPELLDEQLLRAANDDIPAPAYITARVTNAGGVNTTRSGGPPSVCLDDDGNMWTAWRSEGDPGVVRVYLEVRSPSGALIVPRATAAEYSAIADVAAELAGWQALIPTSQGVSLVYATATPELFHIGFELAAGTVSATYAQQDISGLVGSSGAKSQWRWDACSSGGDGMFFLGESGTTTGVVRFEPLLPPFSGAAFASLATAHDLTAADAVLATAVCSFTHGGNRYVVTASGAANKAGSSTPDVHVYCKRWSAGAFVSVWDTVVPSSFATFGVCSVAIQPHHDSSAPGIMVAITGESSGSQGTPITSTAWLSLATGTATAESSYHLGARLAGRGTAYRISDTETYALFALGGQSETGDFAQFDLSNPNIMVDPAVYLMIGQKAPASGTYPAASMLTPVARVGVDGGYPAAHLSTSWADADGSRIILGYALVDYTGDIHAAIPRWVELDMDNAEQPSSARDSGGVATIASAHPAAWDGSELCDVGALHAPVMVDYATIAFGTVGVEDLAAGTYAVRAIFRYRDGSGQLRRSAPSAPAIIVADGVSANARISFAEPVALRRSPASSPPDCVAYMTLTDGKIYYLSTTAQRDSTNSFYVFDSFVTPSLRADGIGDRLFSTGAGNEPLLPMAPPALWDVETVGPRQYGIDAEYRSRVWTTKLKERGVALEWAGELTTDFGEQAGKLVKVVSIGGQPRVLAERGVWAIVGEGPDNTGNGGAFGDPQLISTRGCRSRESVATVPGVGVLFEGDDGVLTMLGGDGVKRFETIAPRSLGAPSIYLAQHEVAWPIKDGDGFLVYNYLRDAFTTWSDLDYITSARCDVITEGAVKTLAMSADAELLAMSAAVPDTTARFDLSRGWVAPNAPDGDIVAREIWLRFLEPESTPAGFSATCEFDYGQGHASVTRTWTTAELADLTRGGKITVAMNLHGVSCRSVKLTLSDTTGGSGAPMRPVNCELFYGATPGNLRRSLRDGPLGSKAIK